VQLEELKKQYNELQKQLAQIGCICSGSIMSLYRKCGKQNCGCKDNSQMRHGPYYIWTRNKMGKTVTRSLSEKQAERCLEYIDNFKKMKEIIKKMKEITIQIVEEGE